MHEPYPPFVGAKLDRLQQHARAMQAYAMEPVAQARTLADQLPS